MISTEPLNPTKPVAAFIEYTLKPLLDDARELVILLDEKGFKKEDLKYAYRLMLIQVAMDFIKTIIVTGAICLTLLRCLPTTL